MRERCLPWPVLPRVYRYFDEVDGWDFSIVQPDEGDFDGRVSESVATEKRVYMNQEISGSA